MVEENNVKILIDPGAWSEIPQLEDIDAILITHDHPDHLNIEKINAVLANNAEAKIFTNKGVGGILEENSVAYELLTDGQNTTIKDVTVEAYGEKHAQVYPSIPQSDNTGYLIAGKLLAPGDNFVNPGKPVEILALAVVAPWMRLADALDYAKNLKPKVCFPVHDGFLKFTGPFHSVPKEVLASESIEFIVPELGSPIIFE